MKTARELPYPAPPGNTRMGVHYFPDTVHYRESDLRAWLPELRAAGVNWLVLTAPGNRAVPEAFITGLLKAGIEPVLHFRPELDRPPSLRELTPILEAYAHWGVQYICYYDRPNQRRSWRPDHWVQPSLVERAMDLFIPVAEKIAALGMTPVTPPLEPGGDYWDTAFLQTAIEYAARRSSSTLMQRMVIGAYGWADEHPIQWGTGGPERFPGARPYQARPGEEDQLGFRVFEWYQAISGAVLGEPIPVLIMGGGTTRRSQQAIQKDMEIVRLLDQESLVNHEPVSDGLLACNFWLLAASPDSPYQNHAWYRSDGTVRPFVDLLKTYRQERIAARMNPEAAQAKSIPISEGIDMQLMGRHIPDYGSGGVLHQATYRSTESAVPRVDGPSSKTAPGLSHNTPAPGPIQQRGLYVLLPSKVDSLDLEAIWVFAHKHRATVGYSVEEAAQARQVALGGNAAGYPMDDIKKLLAAGCQLKKIDPAQELHQDN